MGNILIDGFKSLKFWGKEERLVQEHTTTENAVEINKKPILGNLPAGRVSRNEYNDSILERINDIISLLQADFQFEVIPIIRKLIKVNPDMSQAFQDLVQLANTGHKIKFDPGVSPEQQDKMREELENISKEWGDGVAGMNGLVNKMISQLLVGGAISNEWVPSLDLRINPRIENLVFLGPENIRWGFNKKKGRYEPFQKVTHGLAETGKNINYVKLNKNTYKYYALNGDTDLPYGTPPYLAALEPIANQKYMLDNIKFIVQMIGLLGHMDVKIEKPEMQDNESEVDYKKRLEQLLIDTKKRVQEGFRDGINVGFNEDHEFQFHSTTKSAGNVEDIFNINELQIASALKYDGAFMGRGSTTETMVTILFTKMLSQLTNIQNIVAENLKFGYSLHLRLRGFKFRYLDVEFNKSTITDDLKYQQAQEIKIRNNRLLYADGIISQDQYADNVGYKEPDQEEPRVSINPEEIIDDAAKKKERKDQKDRSSRKGTDKDKPQGTIKDKSKKL